MPPHSIETTAQHGNLAIFTCDLPPTLRKGRSLTWERVKYTDRELSQVEITQEIQRYLKILHLEIYFKQLMESSQATSVRLSPRDTGLKAV